MGMMTHTKRTSPVAALRGFWYGAVQASGPVVCMVWTGVNVVLEGRKMLGATKPSESAMGTIRGDFCVE